jgi:hypothetical protein
MISEANVLKSETDITAIQHIISSPAVHSYLKSRPHDHHGPIHEAKFHPKQKTSETAANMPRAIMVSYSVGELDQDKGDALEELAKDLLMRGVNTGNSNSAEILKSNIELNFPSFSSANWKDVTSDYSKLGRVYVPYAMEKLTNSEGVIASLELDSLEKDWAKERNALRSVIKFHTQGPDLDPQTYSPLLRRKLKDRADNCHDFSNAQRHFKVKTRIIDVAFSKQGEHEVGSYCFESPPSAEDFSERFFLLRLVNSSLEDSRNIDAIVFVFTRDDDKIALMNRGVQVCQEKDEEGTKQIPITLSVIDGQGSVFYSSTNMLEKDMKPFLFGWRSDLNEAYSKVTRSQIPADAILFVVELDRTRQRPPFKLADSQAVESFLERIQAAEDGQKVRTIVLKLCVDADASDVSTDTNEQPAIWDMEPRNIGVYPVQMKIAGRILARVEYVMKKHMGQSLESFEDICFLVFLPPYSSLRDQTLERVQKLFKVADHSTVLMYNKISDDIVQRFRNSAICKPEILHVIIADECHWGVNIFGQFDKWVNDRSGNGELLRQPNVVQLLVSATLYNNLTAQSRIPLEIITEWTDGRQETKPWASEPIEAAAGQISAQHRALPELHVVEWFGKEEKIRAGSYRRFEGFLRTIWSEKRHKNIGMVRGDALDVLYHERIRTDSSLNLLLGHRNAESAKINILISDYVFSLVYFRYVVWESQPELDVKEAAQQIIDKFKQHTTWENYLEKHLYFQTRSEDSEDDVSDPLVLMQNFISVKKKLNSFTETDFIIRDLLFHPDPNIGRMKVIRVYGHEEAWNFVSTVRQCRDDLFPSGQKPFAVFMDDSKIDLQQGLEDEGLMDRPIDVEISGKHFTTLKELSLSKERKDGKLQFKDLDGIPCLLVLVEKGRMGDTFPFSMDCLDLRIRASDNTSTLVQELGRLCQYPRCKSEGEDLFKGDQLDEIKARELLKNGKEVAVFEFLNNEEVLLSFCTHLEPFASCSDIEIIAEGVLTKPEPFQSSIICLQLSLDALQASLLIKEEEYALGLEFKRLNSIVLVKLIESHASQHGQEKDGEVAKVICEFHVVSKPEQQFKVLDILKGLRSKTNCYLCRDNACLKNLVKRARTESIIVRALQDRAPYALIPKDTLISLDGAVKASDEDLIHPRAEISKCIVMSTLDVYMKQQKRGSIKSLKEDCRKMHMYRAHWTANRPKEGSGKTAHCDSDILDSTEARPGPLTHRLRFLLSAECQIGKTGAYISFLQQLRNRTRAGAPCLEVLEPYTEPEVHDVVCVDGNTAPLPASANWRIPYWRDIGIARMPNYSHVRQGKYHARFARFRFWYLIEACLSANWLESYISIIKVSECVLSRASNARLSEIKERLSKRQAPITSIRKLHGNIVVFENFLENTESQATVEDAINWDGRLQPSSRIFTLQSRAGNDELIRLRLNLDKKSLLQWDSNGPLTWTAFFNTQAPEKRKLQKSAPAENIVLLAGERIGRQPVGSGGQSIFPSKLPPGQIIPDILVPRFCCSVSAEIINGPLAKDLFDDPKVLESVKINFPERMRAYLQFDAEGAVNRLGKKAGTFFWIFNPSSGRSQKANLDYRACFDEHHEYAQIIVVKSEEFESYRHAWKNYDRAMILSMPSSIRLKQMDLFKAQEMGIGYSRLFIQLISRLLDLDFVWMLDDNIKETREMDLDQIEEHLRHDFNRPPKLCKLNLPMLHIESIIEERLDPTASDPIKDLKSVGGKNSEWKWIRSPDSDQMPWKKFAPPANLELDRIKTCPVENQNLGDYFGKSSAIGIIGMHRCWQEWMRLTVPFSKTHSVYSFFLLNVRDTVNARIFYSPKPAWEDIDFCFDLVDQGFEVVKVNRWFHSKINMQPPRISRAESEELELFQWSARDSICLAVSDGESGDDCCYWENLAAFLRLYMENFHGEVAIVGDRPSWQKNISILSPEHGTSFKSLQQLMGQNKKIFQGLVYLYPSVDEDAELQPVTDLIKSALWRVKKNIFDRPGYCEQPDLLELILVIPLDAAASGRTTGADIKDLLLTDCCQQILTSVKPAAEDPVMLSIKRPSRMQTKTSEQGREPFLVHRIVLKDGLFPLK